MKAMMMCGGLALAALALGLAGCGLDQHPAYSDKVKFGVRHDPIILRAADLGESFHDPDRPGVLPIMKFDELLLPDRPYQKQLRVVLAGTLKGIIEKDHADFAKMSDSQKHALEDKVLEHPAKHHKEFAAALDKIVRDPALLSNEQRNQLEADLEKMFGTPAKPTINATLAGLEKAEIDELKLDDATLAKGSTRYRVHCMHCHGVAGDGRGPTARWVNPHPRDFRSGLFKFQSVDRTVGGLSPSRADLLRTLRQGIEGTAMPSFTLLSDDDLEAMVSYVMFLSLRGTAEMKTILEFEFKKDKMEFVAPSPIIDLVKFWTNKHFKEGWKDSNSPNAKIEVAEYPYTPAELGASVRRGQMMFTATPSPEFKKEYFDRMRPTIHTDAKTKAQADAIAEAENKAVEAAQAKAKEAKMTLTEKEIAEIKKSINKEAVLAEVDKNLPKIIEAADQGIEAKFNEIAGVKCVSCHTDYGRQAPYKFDEWGTMVRPNNFTIGVFRGGRRDVDIYFRIHSGIPGSEMTPFAKNFKGQERYLWDLVNFVKVAAYPSMHKGLDLRLAP
jgi:mono/diheme cytochrome c family protein